MVPSTAISLDTLDLLDSRLRRLEHDITWKLPVNGETGQAKPEQTITQRLQHVEEGLRDLATNSAVVSNLLQIQAHRHPPLFLTHVDYENEASLPPSNQATRAIVLASAPALHETLSQLRSLNDLALPNDHASASASLISLQPRIEQIALLQSEQAEEVGQLRRRSAALLKRWYEIDTLGLGECCAEWEERLRNVEKNVRQAEALKKREENF